MELDVIYPGRRNKITVQLLDSDNTALDLTGQTIHLSIFSGETEVIHAKQSSHVSPAEGKTNIFIGKTYAALLTPGVHYRWEMSRVDESGTPWPVDNGLVRVADFRGSVS